MSLIVGRISILADRLLPNQCYTLFIGYQKDSDSPYEDVTSTEVVYYAYFYTDSRSSGDLINTQYGTSLDIEWINSFDYELNNNNDNVYMIGLPSDFDFSGDFLSGDILGISYRNYDEWGLGNFVYHALYGIYNVLVTYQDITLDMGMFGVWSSADFVMPNNVFFSFISLIANGLLVLYGIWFMWRFLHMICTFDLDNLSSTNDVLDMF